MSEPLPPDRTEPVNPNVRFERQDANIRAIVVCAVGLIVLTGAVQLLFRGVAGEKGSPGPTTMPADRQGRLQLPRDLEKVPAPRLQVNGTKELDDLRREENAFLDNQDRPATWVEKGKTIRVPVGEAMRLLSDPRTAEALGIQARPVGTGKTEEGKK